MKELKHEDIMALIQRAFHKELPPGSKLIRTDRTQPTEPLEFKKGLSNVVEYKGRKFQKRTILVQKYELIEEYWELPPEPKSVNL